jgi:hypothetical protein
MMMNHALALAYLLRSVLWTTMEVLNDYFVSYYAKDGWMMMIVVCRG